jgi:molybdopterin-guanine dinucleotide biosynthesis protein A
MKNHNEKEIIRKINREYARKHRRNNTMVAIYIPKGIKDEIDNFVKEKGLKISQWVLSMITEKLEKHTQKKYDYVRKEFVEIEEKSEKKKLI